MNGLVAIEPLVHQPFHRASHRRFGIGNLALDHCMEDRVHFWPRKADSGALMVIHHEIDPWLPLSRSSGVTANDNIHFEAPGKPPSRKAAG